MILVHFDFCRGNHVERYGLRSDRAKILARKLDKHVSSLPRRQLTVYLIESKKSIQHEIDALQEEALRQMSRAPIFRKTLEHPFDQSKKRTISRTRRQRNSILIERGHHSPRNDSSCLVSIGLEKGYIRARRNVQ